MNIKCKGILYSSSFISLTFITTTKRKQDMYIKILCICKQHDLSFQKTICHHIEPRINNFKHIIFMIIPKNNALMFMKCFNTF